MGAAVMFAVFLVVLVALSFIPALNLMRDPADSCFALDGRQVLTSTSTSFWPTGVECHLASSRDSEVIDKHPVRSTTFEGYGRWVGVVQMLLLVSALAIVLAAVWSSARGRDVKRRVPRTS